MISVELSLEEVTIWDFGFRYNLPLMEEQEIEVLMIKYEVELKRNGREDMDRYWRITEILGTLYREIMKRRLNKRIEEMVNKVKI